MTGDDAAERGDWELQEWESALTIQVGSSHICRVCGNIVMVTRGSVGVLELICCGVPMERLAATGQGR